MVRDAQQRRRAADRNHGRREQMVDELQQQRRGARFVELLVESFAQLEQSARSLDRILGLLMDSAEEESNPFAPAASLADGEQMIVVLVAVPLEVRAQVQKRLGQQSRCAE